MSEDVTAQARAEKCAALMMEKDAASRGLGMHLDRVAPGMATLSMQVTPEMLNGHGICHGGYIFTLADSAFAFACNTYNQLTVAQQNQITYLAPGKAGDRLTATALEVARAGRSGTYDVAVSDSAGSIIALFRGLSRTIKGQHFPEDGDPA
ncbi:hydroxyphenylacetyl-CoA thioesterase PaaI [uncultured Roseobacter sp.]|uniref:hydroxyphenylacetyl-CoA thioesterase PaaI n=1 Tax=uncultured Roseobacter sp. TaxID=114847 RepID=UPI002628A6D5|nr:hydroxyphenylacetyl-CoA thioesterase PaaI [uncultured Roseobacter sp.]